MRSARQARGDAKRLWRLCLVDGSLDVDRAREIAERMIASQRAGTWPVLAYFVRLLKLDRARHAARVESAAPLDPDVRAAVEQTITRKYGAATTTTFAVEPALIGGMRIRVGSDVYDGSVRAGLEAIEARL